MVQAQLALEQAERLGVGDRAEIHVPGQGEPVLGQIAQIDFTPTLPGNAQPRRALFAAPRRCAGPSRPAIRFPGLRPGFRSAFDERRPICLPHLQPKGGLDRTATRR